MAIAYAAIGSSAAGTTTLSIPLVSGISAGDILLICLSEQAQAVVTPTGWIRVGQSNLGGAGANGADSGTRSCTAFMRIADGTESGNVSITGLTNTCIGVMLRYTKASGKDIQVIVNRGEDNTAGTAWSITGQHSIFKSGDMLLAVSAINTDGRTFSAQAITVTGPTLGTEQERFDGGTANGNDCGLVISEHPITTANHSAGFSYAMTASGTASNEPAGATLFIQLREVDPPTEIEGLQALTLITTQGEPDKPIVGLNGVTFLFEDLLPGGVGLSIKVEDSRGRGLSGVFVTVSNPDTTNPVSSFTDTNGNVVLDQDGSNPNPITVTLGKLSKTVNYVSGDNLVIVFDNAKPIE